MQIRFSIRTRILSLLIGGLTASLVSYIVVGSKLLIQDKTSYIYDYSFSQTRLLSDTIENKLSPLVDLAHRLDSEPLGDPKSLEPLAEAIQAQWIAIQEPGQNLTVVYRPANDKENETPIEIPPNESLGLQIDLGKKVIRFGYKLDSGRVLYSTSSLLNSPLEGLGAGFEVDLIDLRAHKILFRKSPTIAAPALNDALSAGLLKTDFKSGAKEALLNNKSYLMGYEQALSGRLLILSLISQEAAFSAAKQLILRTTVLGASVFLATLGLTLFLLRGLIVRINELVQATEKVSDGDFSAQVSEKSRTKDEVTTLAHSFNLMSRKIQQLLSETADKARMEKELETAQLVQNTFFPNEDFEESGVRIRGKTITASECGGDFWQYAKIQDFLLLIMGDVTGHGASAALLTASIHGAFSLFVNIKQESVTPLDPAKDIIMPLAVTLHRTLLSSAKGSATFPCIVAVIDLKKKRLHHVNASHPMPYVFKPTGTKFEALSTERNLPQFGQYSDDDPVTPNEIDLSQGADLIWYTDGFFDARSSDGKKLKKKEVLDSLSTEIRKEASDPLQLAVDLAHEHFGQGPSSSAPDDITILHVSCR